MSLLQKLKQRWHIESNIQVAVILIVFSVTGFSAVYAKEFIFDLLSVDPEWPLWIRILIWVVTILPVYNVLLVFYGTLFGQRLFFWRFVKKTVGRLVPSGGNGSSADS